MDAKAERVANQPKRSLTDYLEAALPKLVLAPTFIAALLFIYGYIIWTAVLSFTTSTLLPRYEWAGFTQYARLFTNERWWVACQNLVIFGSLFILLCMVVGLFLAILLDQRVRAEGALRTVYLYPMALSFIVTGTVWQWILNPSLGLENLVRNLRLRGFHLRLAGQPRPGPPTGPSTPSSSQLVVPAVAISTLIGAFNGYVLTKWRFRGSDLFFSLLLIGCFIPFQVILLPMARTLGELGISGSISGLIFVHVVYGLAFTTLFFRNFYVSIPDELVRAAKIDGAGFFRIFWRIILPLSTPIIVVSVIWQFTQIWNDFLFGVVYSAGDQQPITVALNNLVKTTTGVKEYNVDMAAAIIAALPTLFVYVVAGKYFVRGLTAGSVKG